MMVLSNPVKCDECGGHAIYHINDGTGALKHYCELHGKEVGCIADFDAGCPTPQEILPKFVNLSGL